MWDSFKEKVFNHATFKKVEPLEAETFTLDKNYSDTELQEKCNSQAIDVDTFLVSVQKLIEEGKIGKNKYHIVHVKTGQGVVAVSFDWRGDRFDWDADPLDDGGRWAAGRVFLFFATETKKLKSSSNFDTFESLNLRLEKLEEWAKNIGYYQ